MTVSVLFVCLGNICRSPLAEAAFRAEAQRIGLKAEVDSAGTGEWHIGRAPDPRAQAVARRGGSDISRLRARQVTAEDFQRFDHIVALDGENLRALEALRPAGARARISLLMDHVPGRKGDPVDDPYYGDETHFERAWSDVSLAAAALADRLRGSN